MEGNMKAHEKRPSLPGLLVLCHLSDITYHKEIGQSTITNCCPGIEHLEQKGF
jgi:hypothetical protein